MAIIIPPSQLSSRIQGARSSRASRASAANAPTARRTTIKRSRGCSACAKRAAARRRVAG